MSSPNQLGFQNSATFIMQEFDHFHNYTMIFIVFITVLTLYSLASIWFNAPSFRNFLENQSIELAWTIFPSFILIALAIPSINLLYLMDESNSPDITIKTIGHQWYWTYEIWDNTLIELDSYMINLENISQPGLPRLLEVDNRLTLPINNNIRVITTSTDVIHAWTVPALGLKMDAVPGRLNQMFTNIDRPGVFYGQCSEICGANHSFMPIVLEVTNQNEFHNWCEQITNE
uniref:Cytochrome c oxidase subunit 2 n=1 Tax=Ophiophthalmus serratus TaxID=2993811 RepID=A0A9E8ICU7_9ECHI|nr:cytochrome c oxidase subunit II [Ophiophthalmus serratus]UZG65881.1 cytochrome c oxidase subunit 2 [Ophiophthalmus serratus]